MDEFNRRLFTLVGKIKIFYGYLTINAYVHAYVHSYVHVYVHSAVKRFMRSLKHLKYRLLTQTV